MERYTHHTRPGVLGNKIPQAVTTSARLPAFPARGNGLGAVIENRAYIATSTPAVPGTIDAETSQYTSTT
jgi:hypothetical protein